MLYFNDWFTYRYSAFTPNEMLHNTRTTMKRMHPGAIIEVAICNAAHDWSGTRAAMQTFSGIMSATRKLKVEQRATVNDAGEASTSVYAVPYEAAHSVDPLGCTFGDMRIESSFPLFVGEPTLPTKMQPHDAAGLAKAKLGIKTCKKVLEKTREHDYKRHYVRRSPGDKRPYVELVVRLLLCVGAACVNFRVSA
jgi:hypothetical protein